jgi:hypothetical protein
VLQAFRWVKLSELRAEHMTFLTDQHVASLLIEEQ